MTVTRILVPYLPDKLHPTTLLRILEQMPPGWRVEPVDVSGSDTAYYEAVKARWNAAPSPWGVEDLVIVEHDIELPAGALAGFDGCPSLWCAHDYPVYWGSISDTYGGPWGLGCVRYRAQLQRQHPDLLTADVPTFQAEVRGELRDGRYWMNFDAAMAQWLRGPYGHVAHRHRPDAIHHHQYDYAGAYVTDEVRAMLPAGHPLKEAPVG